MKLQELNKNEQMAVNGGGEASDAFWTLLGMTLRAIWCFSEGAKDGGYANCKCP